MPALTGISNPATDQLLNAYLGAGSNSGSSATRSSGAYAGLSPDEIVRQMYQNGFTQEGVNRVYELRGLANPPTVPSDLTGRGYTNTRGGRRWADGSQMTGTANSFLNTFNTTAVDPYRKPSGISNLAGGVLGLVGSAVGGPIWTGLTAAADYGNAALGNRSSSSDLGPYGAIGTAVGSIYSAAGGPGSYGASTAGGTENTGGVIDESGAMGGVGGSGNGGFGGFGGFGGNMPSGSTGFNWQDWIPSLVTAGASLIGADRAGDAVQAGSREAINESRRQFDLVRGDTAPLRALGAASIGTLADLSGYNESGTPNMEAFYTSPEYSFNLSEGQKAIDRSAAARGGLLSGAAVKEGQRYASGLASREHSAFIDRLLQQAGLGNTGIGASAAAGANSASNIGNAAINAGNARASIYGDTAANLNNAFQSGYSNMMLRRYLGG